MSGKGELRRGSDEGPPNGLAKSMGKVLERVGFGTEGAVDDGKVDLVGDASRLRESRPMSDMAEGEMRELGRRGRDI